MGQADKLFNMKYVDPNAGGKGDRDDRRAGKGSKGGKGARVAVQAAATAAKAPGTQAPTSGSMTTMLSHPSPRFWTGKTRTQYGNSQHKCCELVVFFCSPAPLAVLLACRDWKAPDSGVGHA